MNGLVLFNVLLFLFNAWLSTFNLKRGYGWSLLCSTAAMVVCAAGAAIAWN